MLSGALRNLKRNFDVRAGDGRGWVLSQAEVEVISFALGRCVAEAEALERSRISPVAMAPSEIPDNVLIFGAGRADASNGDCA